MPPDWVYHVAGLLLVVANVAAWIATLFTLPGTWIIVGLAALAAWFLPEADGRSLGVGWWEVAVLAALAVVGEIVELLGGAAGAQQAGASRRSMALALVGASAGSLLGALIGIPIPLVGPLLAALAGGGAGAFAGAYVGEAWKGRRHDDRLLVGRVAFVGRLVGTAGKLGIGLVMVLAAAVMYWLV